MIDAPPLERLPRTDGHAIAYRRRPGVASRAGFVWLGGFRSDMDGTKAVVLDAWAAGGQRPFLRFDYFGHGASTGDFADGTIGRWKDDALAAIDRLTDGPQVLVGSSMGGWIAILAALARPDRVAGLYLIAPAPDFTERLMRPNLSEAAQAALDRDGVWLEPSDYDPEPTPITRRLLDESRDHLVLDGPIRLDVPVRIVQGRRDPDVPWEHALAVMNALTSDDVVLHLVKNGDHRLSTSNDLERLLRVAGTLGGLADAAL